MKQNEIITGESYLFTNTDVDHRKNMIGTTVTVVGRKGGNKKHNYQGGILTGTGKSPMKFKLNNGQSCNAANLRAITS